MAQDVLITPASAKVEFKTDSIVDAKIETDANGNLTITNPGGDISIGDISADLYIGDGVSSVDIIFEQNGEIRGLAGKTLTLGQSDSFVQMATDLNVNNNGLLNIDWANSDDGAGSGLDADLLDGQQGSYYTGYTDTAVANLVASAPTTLDTLNELAAALGDDPNFATTVTTSIGTKANSSITISAGSGLTGGGNLTANRTISHSDTSSQASVNNSNGNVIQDVTLDGFGHVTGLASIDLDGRYDLKTDYSIVRSRGSVASDLNDAGMGIWRVDTGLTNQPSTNHNYGTLVSFDNSSDTGFQFIASYNSSNDLRWRGGNSTVYGGTGAFQSWQQIFHDSYHPNADKWTTARTNTVTLTGATTGTGSASVDGTGNWTVTVNTSLANTYDNYSSWTAKDHDGTTYTVTSGDTLWFKEGSGIDVNFTADDELTISHADTSSQGSVDNSNGTVIQDVTLDGFGHVTGLASVDLDTRYAKRYEGSATIVDATNYTQVAKVTGDRLGSAIRFAVNGTSNGVVINIVADILVNHSGDIIINAISGNYTQAYIQVVSDSNANYDIRLRGTGAVANTPVSLDIFTMNDETVAFTGTTSYSTTTLTHLTYPGVSQSVSDSGAGDLRVDDLMYVNTDQRVFADDYHPNADTWTTARTNTVTLTGDVTGTGSASVNGSGNWTVSIPAVVANDSHSHSNYVTTTYNSSLNSDSRNSRGVTRLYRRDNDSDYSLQHEWTGSHWYLRGYIVDNYHAETRVGVADTWTTARTNTVTLTGDVTGTGSASVNGSGNWTVSIPTSTAIFSHSGSDFADGTLVTTDIPANVSSGASFVIEVTGKSYSAEPPFSFIAQGYLYNDTIINYSGINNGDTRLTYIKAMNNGGNLCFWWPRVSYWNSFEVRVKDAGGDSSNRITSIANSTDPSGATKKVTITLSKSWASHNDGSGSGLDADLLDGQHGSYYAPLSSLGGYVAKAGDTMTGTLTQSYGGVVWSHSEGTNRPLSRKTYSEAGNIGTTGNNITDVYGEADLTAIDDNVTFTYAQAWAALETHGARLPTLAELLDGVGMGSGQGYDSQYLWTCTPAGPHHVWVAPGAYTDSKTPKIVDITDPLEVYRTRGFFDVSRSNRQITYDNDGELRAKNNLVFHDGYHPNADKWTTARTNTVTLTGDVTGSGNASVDGTGNWTVSISTAVGNDSHSHSNYVLKTGDTMTGDLVVSKTSPLIRLYDSNTATGNYPAIEFDTANNQGISLYFNEFDGEIPLNGYGMVFGPSTTNTQFPSTGQISLNVLGEIFAGGTALGSLNKVFHDGYHPNADKWTTSRTLSLTGAVTGSASIDGSGNVSLATTATSDPTLTLTGDVTGSATFTNLGNATLTATVANDSHSHSNYLLSNGTDDLTGIIRVNTSSSEIQTYDGGIFNIFSGSGYSFDNYLYGSATTNYVTLQPVGANGLHVMGTILADTTVDAPSFREKNNTSYYLDPASTSTSLNVAGSIVAAGSATANHFKHGNTTTTATSKTLTAGEFCTVTAATQTITLPATPSAGDNVTISVGNFTDTIIARNGANIMGLAENLTIDVANAGITLAYSGNATQGWRII